MNQKTKGKGLRHQHYIPRLLLKGFSCPESKEEIYVYQFRLERKPHKANIKNIAQERDFYGNPNESEIEWEMSLREGEYDKLLVSIRNGGCSQNLKPLTDEFMAHLIMRTKSARDSVVSHVKSGVRSMVREIRNPEPIKKIPKLMEKMIERNPQLQSRLAQLPRAQKRLLIKQLQKSDQIKDSVKEVTDQQLSEINHPNFARNSHQKALEGDQALEKRLEFLRPINWSVQRFPQYALVLGDIGAIFKESPTGKWENPILARSIHRICLPISTEVLLVGEGTDRSQWSEINVEEINLASVELSRELFIASTCTQRELGYHRHLGKRGDLIDENQIRRVISDTIDSF